MSGTQSLAAVILAAGHGKRMKSELPKVLHEVGGEPLILHVIRQARGCGADPVVVVVGHGRERVIPVVRREGVQYAVQERQLGTGHAVLAAREYLEGGGGDVVVLSGDVPLLSVETLRSVIAYHRRQGAVATMITAEAPDPSGYGRVLRGEDGRVIAIREDRDCTPGELEVTEINSGIYIFRVAPLFEALETLDNDNAQGEYYLPDVFRRFFDRGLHVAALPGRFEEVHGINTPEDLARANSIWAERKMA